MEVDDNLFQNLLASIQRDVVHAIYHVGFAKKETTRKVPVAAPTGGGSSRPQAKAGGRKVGRNEPCPCGSGKKYKHCCGR